MRKKPSATIRALKGSIRKWEGVVSGKIEDKGTDNCQLCAQFFYNTENCGLGTDNPCPVAAKTGKDDCRGTPYSNFCRASPNGFATTPEAKKHARRMLAFLKRLLLKKLEST